jgi:23S rRNA pseudouridine2604 synthase
LEPIRLNKRMGQLGLCSRREADEWIERGWVKVNGKVAMVGSKVTPNDRIQVERLAQQEQAAKVTFLMNKPIGFVSAQAEDGYQAAVSLLGDQSRWREDRAPGRFSTQQRHGLAPAGRLDIDSTGLLVLTQDGRIARQLIGENSLVEKEYLVRVRYGSTDESVQASFPMNRLMLLRHGLELDGEALEPAKVDWQNSEQLRFVLVEGKKRQIRRMCEAVGLEVTGLKRIRIGQVKLGALPVGQWRYLSPNEFFT